MTRALLVSGDSGQSHGALSTVRLLGAAGHAVDVAVTGSWSCAAWSRHTVRRILVPRAEDEGFADAVRNLVEQGGYDMVMPTSDAALVALRRPEAALVDKNELVRRIEAAGFPGANNDSFEDGAALASQAARLTYPVVVKSAVKIGQGHTMARRFDSPDDLARAVDCIQGRVVTQTWLQGAESAIAGVVWGGRWRATVHQRASRTWPRDAGVSTVSSSLPADREAEERVLALLGDYEGLVQVQTIGEHVIDVNPRPYGSVALGAAAGVNLPDIAMRLATGQPTPSRRDRPPDEDGVVRVPAGIRYRWVEGDVRTLVSGLRARDLSVVDALRALRPRWGTVHPDVQLRDPAPSLARLAFVASTWRLHNARGRR